MKTHRTNHLFLKFGNEIKAFIKSKVKDADLAHDLMQDTFIKAHLKIDQLEDPEKIKQWLYSIARNMVIDHFRREKIKINNLEHLNDFEETPDIENEMTRCISPMISKLPPAYREALMEVEIKGTDQKSLAQKLMISYSGAKSRVQRAREMLKARLLDCCKISADKYGNIISHAPRNPCTGC